MPRTASARAAISALLSRHRRGIERLDPEGVRDCFWPRRDQFAWELYGTRDEFVAEPARDSARRRPRSARFTSCSVSGVGDSRCQRAHTSRTNAG
jgi:hypothetical protein